MPEKWLEISIFKPGISESASAAFFLAESFSNFSGARASLYFSDHI